MEESGDRMTKTCATCKHVQIEAMSVPFLSYSHYYFKYAKNIEFQKENKEHLVKFDLFTCNHQDIFYDDPISGEKISKGNMCSDLREKYSNFCGLSGEMWEVKE